VKRKQKHSELMRIFQGHQKNVYQQVGYLHDNYISELALPLETLPLSYFQYSFQAIRPAFIFAPLQLFTE
jgi:hypothetical protein